LVTRERVRQIETKALARLGEHVARLWPSLAGEEE
jgi:DNA-directed RNA polymerase sigma subunit (sigma70/sigma32)